MISIRSIVKSFCRKMEFCETTCTAIFSVPFWCIVFGEMLELFTFKSFVIEQMASESKK